MIHLAWQAIEASTQSPLEEVRKPAEQLLKACEEIPGYTSVLATIAGTHAADADARAGAVILLKNMVRARWKSRGGRGVVVGDGEKAALRGFLLRSMEEPEARVASQVHNRSLRGREEARYDIPGFKKDVCVCVIYIAMVTWGSRGSLSCCVVEKTRESRRCQGIVYASLVLGRWILLAAQNTGIHRDFASDRSRGRLFQVCSWNFDERTAKD